MLKAQQLKPLKNQLRRLKYNKEFFNSLLQAQPKYAISDADWSIVLGNMEADNVITMVSNPYCGPCSKAHQLLDEWLQHRDDLQLKLVFVTDHHENGSHNKVARHVAALSLLEDKNILGKALNDWYNQINKKYETWAEKYPVTFDGAMEIVIEKQRIWCEMTEITFTPTILINGYKLPEPYRLEDIKYLIN